MPPRGLCESVYTALRARDGYWSPDFLHVVATAYRGIIPPRFVAIADRIAREFGPAAHPPPTGLPPTITLVYADGREESWQPTLEEWDEAGT